MAIPPSGTFDYFVKVPDHNQALFPWSVQVQGSVERTGDSLTDSRLVGLSPRLQITDAGMTPDRISAGPTREQLPKVLRSQLTLIASERTGASVARASFFVDKGLTSRLLPCDVMHMARTCCGGLGISVIRDGQLVVAAGAVTAVPLGNDIEARVCRELIQQAEALFRARDPDFEFLEFPVEVRVGNERRVLFRGWPQLGAYKIFSKHGFLSGLPGMDECLGISQMGACPDTTASCSALLMDSAGALEMVRW